MKKSFLKKVLLIMGIATVIYFATFKEKTPAASLFFSNVEALASGESGGALHCFGYGSVDCQGYMVKWKMNRSLPR